MMVCLVVGPRTVASKEAYRAKNAPTAHLGPGVQRLAHRWVHSRSRAPLERGVEKDGPTSGQYPGAQAPWASRPTFESWSVPSPWFFLIERQRALGTSRTDRRTIWIGRQESGVGHQMTHARPPGMGSWGPTSTSPLTAHRAPCFVHRAKTCHSSAPPFYQKKRLRDNDHKDEPTLDRTPATRGGSRKVGLARRPNARS